MSAMSDPKLQRSMTLGIADMGRQVVMDKANVKASKSIAVAGSSLMWQYVLAGPVQQAMANWNQADLSYAWDLLVETFGVATTLYIFESVGVVSKKDAEIEGESKKSSKRGRFMKSVALAGIDVMVAEVILTLMGGKTILSSDPSAPTVPNVTYN